MAHVLSSALAERIIYFGCGGSATDQKPHRSVRNRGLPVYSAAVVHLLVPTVCVHSFHKEREEHKQDVFSDITDFVLFKE